MKHEILDHVPEGWIETKGQVFHPKGTKWYNNGKSRFSAEYKYALVIIDKQAYKNHGTRISTTIQASR